MRSKGLEKIFGVLLNVLYKKTIVVLTILLVFGILITLWNFSRLSSRVIEVQALENSKAYANALKEARNLYTSQVVPTTKAAGIPFTHDRTHQQGSVPLPATYLIELGEKIGISQPGFSVRLYSHYPFPWRKQSGGARDAFEEEALNFLEQHPAQIFFRTQFYKGRLAFRYAQADLMKASCVGCHNTHPDSPRRDWKVGDVRGVLEITQPIDLVTAQVQRGLRGTSVILACMGSLALLGITIVITKLRNTSKELEIRVRERTAELMQEKEKSEHLLLNILPEPIAHRLKNGHQQIADGFALVTILFADIVGFTSLSEQIPPDQLVNLLNLLFSEFDRLSDRYGLEKIKTIGDAYMVAGGLPDPNERHAAAIADMALDMMQVVRDFSRQHQTDLNLRIGINSGPVTAGVIGQKKFIYDLWGDAVNTASRMESQGIPGQIQVTEATYELLQADYELVQRGTIQIKGKGEMATYLLMGKKSVMSPSAETRL